MRAAAALATMRQLPVRPITDLLAGGPLLILAPHPDDESLGCGGIIAASCAAGVPPIVLVMTDGAGSHPKSKAYPPERLVAVREAEARDAVAVLGLPPDRIAFMRLPDTRSPLRGTKLRAAAKTVAGLAAHMGAGAILSTWASDPHRDHLSAHRIAAQAAASAGVAHLAYPVWGWTLSGHARARPVRRGMRVDVSAFLEAKRRAIAAHRSQYAGLITDDPSGFQMEPGFMALFTAESEVVVDA